MINRFEDVIIQTICRLLVPPIQLFALYVIAHGHYSPGGGFQGGCILAASFILLVIAYDLKEASKRMSEKINIMYCCIGVIIYSGIGLLCVILGSNYLDYGILNSIIPVEPAAARSLGILGVEIGVGIAVMAVMVSIFINIASGGEHGESEELE
ncbi:MAG: Na(+)/H(+) antiporter subunit B [Thermodesulfovibrionales bacterium]|nr:Na(+)/H(+) antiporter subunit B [Thermodesulfovibrionales bacterium]